MNEQKLVFLLGAGISSPDTQAITKGILTGDNIYANPDYIYDLDNEKIQKYILLLNSIRLYMVKNIYPYSTGVEVDYEELYYIITQLVDDLNGDYDNPIATGFLKLLRQEGIVNEEDDDILLNFLSPCRDYMVDVVCQKLVGEPKDLEAIHIVEDAYKDDKVQNIDIFTLNHDLLLEKFLCKKGIQYSDGFSPPLKFVRYWKPEAYSENLKVRLFKLHGSIKWFSFCVQRNNFTAHRIVMCTNWNRAADEYGQPYPDTHKEKRPEILMGRHNKLLSYSHPIYLSLLNFLLESLSKVRRVIVTGYSFRDKGINAILVDWLGQNPNNLIIVIHPKPETLEQTVRPAIRKQWNRIEKIKSCIEDTNWQKQVAPLLVN